MVSLEIGIRFPGNCEEAFKFYKSVFGGDLIMLQRYKELKKQGMKVAKEDENKLTFVGLPVGKNYLLMGDDSPESEKQELVQGNSMYIQISAESKEEADRIFASLSAGGFIKMPMADVFWGEYFGYLKDKFGVWWTVVYHYPKEK